MEIWKKPSLKAFAALCGNLSAAWFALAIVSPNFESLFTTEGLIILTRNMLLGIVFLLITIIIERNLMK